jgi:hypothetical protein
MKILQFCFVPMVLFCTLFFALSNVPMSADDKPPDTRKLIDSIDASASTIVLNDRKHNSFHTYRVDDMTKLIVNGIPGKFGDIKPGMEVKDFIERDNDTLDNLTLVGYGDEPAKK